MRRPLTMIVGLLLGLGIAGSAHGQEASALSRADASKLDASLRSLVAPAPNGAKRSGGDVPVLHPGMAVSSSPEASTNRAAPNEGATDRRRADPPVPRYRVLVRTRSGRRLPAPRLRREGMQIGRTLGPITTARLTADDVIRLARRPDVVGLSASPRNEPLKEPVNDAAAGLSGIRVLNNGGLNGTSYTGEGVAACLIDSGIDIRHLDFRSLADTTQSRIVSIWDQTLTARPGEGTPDARRDADFDGLRYGVEYQQSEIEDELDGTPSGAVRHADFTGHGTHVAGTFAGNSGADPLRRYTGMAPDARLIIVKTDYSSVGLLDGLAYCGEVAADEGLPVVANLSLGTDYGPHDGTLAQDVGISRWARAVPGRAVAIGAGNSADDGIHVSGQIRARESETVPFDVERYDARPGAKNDDVRINLWFDGDPQVSVDVRSPNGHVVSTSVGENAAGLTPDGRVRIVQGVSTGNGDLEVIVAVDDSIETRPPASGTWSIEVTNPEPSPSRYHGWLYYDTMPVAMQDGDAAYTITSPGSAITAITAGAYVHQYRWCADSDAGRDSAPDCYQDARLDGTDALSAFSSHGPLRNGRIKPDLAAPGQVMASSYSRDFTSAASRVAPGGRHRYAFGTSMSTPVAAGAAALLLQENPSLTAQEIRTALTTGAAADEATGLGPNTRWGYGKLDAVGAMGQVMGATPSRRREVLAYDGWEQTGTRSMSGESAAVRFSPTIEGFVSGVLLHTATNSSIDDSLTICVWSDDGTGVPAEQLGAPVRIAPASLAANSWSYLDLMDAGVYVHPGSTYHLGIQTASTADLQLLVDVGQTDGRTSRRTRSRPGAPWRKVLDHDLKVRPIVSTGGNSRGGDSRITRFRVEEKDRKAVLSWQARADRDVDRYVLEQARDGDRFRRLGFVGGGSASQDTEQYRYTTSALDPGRYRFRVRQVRENGATRESRERALRIGMRRAYELSPVAPNPVGDRASFQLRVQTPQRVRVSLYNVLGQHVQTVHDDVLAANRSHVIVIEGSPLASGMYFVRIIGEEFQTTRKFVRIQ
jgi:subtilisin family serine protease